MAEMVETPSAAAEEVVTRYGAAALAAGRTLVGVVALVRPRLAARVWVGPGESRRLAAGVFGRALGGRDIGLGLGALWALSRRDGVRGWIAAGAIADTADLLASLAAWRNLPTWARVLVVPASGGAAVAGALAAIRLTELGDR